MSASAFSPDYTAARARFRSSAIALHYSVKSWSIEQRGPDGEELTIDVAAIGDVDAERVVIVSSGLYGIDGFVGSAVQAALLEEQLGGFATPPKTRLLLIHGLNPFGFAWLRRANEENVDLSHNFLFTNKPYLGASPAYLQLDSLLNPKEPPQSVDLFQLKMGYQLLKQGPAELKKAWSHGQYQFPKGLYFGGTSPSRTAHWLDSILPTLIPNASRVLHIDVHTAVGQWAKSRLYVDSGMQASDLDWLSSHFGADVLHPREPSSGGMGEWLPRRFPKVAYDVLDVDFGTYSLLKTLTALRAENQAYFWGGPNHPATPRTKSRLREIFVPVESAWREQVVEQGVKIVEQAIEALLLTK